MALKGTLKIPKEKQECKDGKCGHSHEVEIEIPEIKPQPATITAQPTPEPKPVETPAPEPHSHDIRTDHAELAELMPKGTNFAKCADGNCGNEIIKNSKLTKKFKTCTNCNANGVPKSSDLCPTCGVKEPTDEDEKENFWDDSDIDSEKIGDDED